MEDNKALTYFNRGIQKSLQEDYYGAIQDFSKALSEDPTFTLAYIKRAQTKCSTQEISQILDAFSDYDIAVKLDPSNAEALMGRGNLCIQLNSEDPQGLNDLEAAAKIDPSICSYYNIGIAKIKKHDYLGSIKSFHDFIEIEKPQDWSLGESYYFTGLAYRKLNQWENAIENFSKAILNKASFNYLWAFFNRALAYSQIQELDEAIEDYSKVIQLKPDMIDAYVNRSKIYRAKNEKNKAIQDLAIAWSLDKHNTKVADELLTSLMTDKDYNEAIKYLTVFIENQPNSAQHYQNRGVCYFALKKYEESIQDFDLAIKLDVNAAHPYYYRGLCHFNLKNDQACDDWKTSFEKGWKDAKPMRDKYCKNQENFGIDVGNGLWISLDDFNIDKPEE